MYFFMHLKNLSARQMCCPPTCQGSMQKPACQTSTSSAVSQGIFRGPLLWPLGRAVPMPSQNQGLCVEMGPCLPGTVDRGVAAKPPGSQLPHSLPPPQPVTWAVVENPKFVSGDCFLHHLLL